MKYDLIIRNGQMVRDSVERADVAVVDQKIVEIGPELSGDARETIDATGLQVFPGLIDPHVHFNEPGRTEWEGIATGSSALAAGGGTCFFDMPLNSSPPVLDAASFDAKLAAMREKSLTDFGLWGGLTPNNLDRMEELAERGVVGFKAFMCDSGIDDFPRADDATLKRGMSIAARLGLLVAVHAENQNCLDSCRTAVTGKSWEDYLSSRPVACELTATLQAIGIARETGCTLHIVHVSDPYVVFHVQKEKSRGVDVTCETCPHYYMLNPVDLERLGARAKCAPPIRESARAPAWFGDLLGSMIDWVASDHSPAPPSMKFVDDPFTAWGGIAGVQSTLPSLVTERRGVSLERIAKLTASNAAVRFRIPHKGRIELGHDGDIALVDVNAKYTLERDMLLDRHKLSPYVGRTFHGLVRRTIVRGTTVFLDGKIVSKPIGRLVRPA